MTKLETHNINSDGQIRHNPSPIFQVSLKKSKKKILPRVRLELTAFRL